MNATTEPADKSPYKEGQKVSFQGKVYDFGYYAGRGDYCVLYEEGERNMQDSVSVPAYNVQPVAAQPVGEQAQPEWALHNDDDSLRICQVLGHGSCKQVAEAEIIGWTREEAVAHALTIVTAVNAYASNQKRIAELESWKRQALPLLTAYDNLSESIGGKLGSSKVTNLENFVRGNQKRIEVLTDVMRRAEQWFSERNIQGGIAPQLLAEIRAALATIEGDEP